MTVSLQFVRNSDCHTRAAHRTLSYFDGAMVGVHQRAGQGKSNAKPFVCARAHVFYLVELAKHALSFLLRDSGPRVVHVENEEAILPLHQHLHPSSLGSKLESVGNQVTEDGLHVVGIKDDRRDIPADRVVQVYPFALGQSSVLSHVLVQPRGQVDGLWLRMTFQAAQGGEVEQVAGQGFQSL